MASLVTLTTDFEERDPYAASVKGVLYSQCPGVQIADLSHAIPRNDVLEGAMFLAGTIPYFPDGAVHLVGVAPGKRPIIARIKSQYVVCPDNGLLTIVAERVGLDEAWEITAPDLLAPRDGQIFYNRDVFAPAAARLAAGTAPAELGAPIEDVELLELPKPEWEAKGMIMGRIFHIDRFGNLVTNIHQSFLEGANVTNVEIAKNRLGAMSKSFADVPAGSPVILYGSAGYLEVAYNGDRAHTRLNVGKGVVVKVLTDRS